MIGRALLALCFVAAGCGEARQGRGRDGPPRPASVPLVEAVRAKHEPLPVRERLTGVVRASGQVTIYPQASGPVTAVYVQNGDPVKAGDRLVRVQSDLSASQLEQARASVSVAEADADRMRATLAELESVLARTEALAQEKLASAEMVETERARLRAMRAGLAQAEARVQQAKAAVNERAQAVGQSIVRAPIDGRVGLRSVEVGMMVDPSTPLFTIGDFAKMRVDVDVPQELLARVQPGKPVEIAVGDAAALPVLATISRVSPFLRRGSFSASAEIDVDDPDGRLVPGMFVALDVLYGQTDPVTVVPRSALTEHALTGARGVYVAERFSGDAETKAPVPFRFVVADVVEEGAHVAGLRALDPAAWVVVVGQHLLMQAGDAPKANVRPVSWERVLGQQRLQREDLLRAFLEKQRRLAETP